MLLVLVSSLDKNGGGLVVGAENNTVKIIRKLKLGVSTGTRCRAITRAVEMRMEARLALHGRE